MIPPEEEIAVFLNVLVDPRSEFLVAYSIASPQVEASVHVVAPSRDHDMVLSPPCLTPLFGRAPQVRISVFG